MEVERMDSGALLSPLLASRSPLRREQQRHAIHETLEAGLNGRPEAVESAPKVDSGWIGFAGPGL